MLKTIGIVILGILAWLLGLYLFNWIMEELMNR